MRYGIGPAAWVAILAFTLAIAGGAEAGNRKAFKKLMAEADAYCAEIKKNEVYDCSIEKCPCEDGLREVKRFDKLRTRPACVCTADLVGRSQINEANAADYCVDWNHRRGKEGDHCFVVAGTQCPEGTSELKGFYRLRGRGPKQTACRGEPPDDEEEEEPGEGETAEDGS